MKKKSNKGRKPVADPKARLVLFAEQSVIYANGGPEV